MDGDLSGAKAVLLETGILHLAKTVMAPDLLEYGAPQHSLTLAVNKDEALSGMSQMFAHCLVELVELVVEDVGVGHAGGGIEQLVDVEVDHDGLGAVALPLPLVAVAMRSGLAVVDVRA